MQMADSDFTLNDWRRRLGGGGAVLYPPGLAWTTDNRPAGAIPGYGRKSHAARTNYAGER